MSWAIRYDGTGEYLKAWEWKENGSQEVPFVFATKKEALAKISQMNHLKFYSLVPIEVDLPVRDKIKFHKFKRGKR